MNTRAEYRRHSYRPTEPAAPQTEAVVDELARHSDPSLATTGAPQARPQRGVAWVRPTDLATYAGPLLGRGIDLQTELIRRARRTPTTTARAICRKGGPSPIQPTSTANQEGLQL